MRLILKLIMLTFLWFCGVFVSVTIIGEGHLIVGSMMSLFTGVFCGYIGADMVYKD